MKKKIDYEMSSGNVFADLGLPYAEELLIKSDLVYQINNIIKKKKLNQAQAAKLLNIDQPKISALNRGKLSGFSLERLIRFLNILDQEITIKVTPKKKSHKKTNFEISLPVSIKKKPVINRQPIVRDGVSIQARKKKLKKR
jgi:predicted XRE-type DNA-binding protein